MRLPTAPVAALALALALLALARGAAATCVPFPGNISSSAAVPHRAGRCVAYSGVCQGVVGASVWVPDEVPLAYIENNITANIRLATANAAGIRAAGSPQACVYQTQALACFNQLYPCAEVTNENGVTEAVPTLPCNAVCQSFWTVCRNAQDSYYAVSFKQTLSGSHASSPFCGGSAQFSADISTETFPADTFGARYWADPNGFPAGYQGQLRYPDTYATYNFTGSKGTTQTQCYTPNVPTTLGDNLPAVAPLCAGAPTAAPRSASSDVERAWWSLASGVAVGLMLAAQRGA